MLGDDASRLAILCPAPGLGWSKGRAGALSGASFRLSIIQGAISSRIRLYTWSMRMAEERCQRSRRILDPFVNIAPKKLVLHTFWFWVSHQIFEPL